MLLVLWNHVETGPAELGLTLLQLFELSQLLLGRLGKHIDHRFDLLGNFIRIVGFLRGCYARLSHPLLLMGDQFPCPLIGKYNRPSGSSVVMRRVAFLTGDVCLLMDVEVGTSWQTSTLDFAPQESSELAIFLTQSCLVPLLEVYGTLASRHSLRQRIHHCDGVRIPPSFRIRYIFLISFLTLRMLPPLFK